MRATTGLVWGMSRRTQRVASALWLPCVRSQAGRGHTQPHTHSAHTASRTCSAPATRLRSTCIICFGLRSPSVSYAARFRMSTRVTAVVHAPDGHVPSVKKGTSQKQSDDEYVAPFCALRIDARGAPEGGGEGVGARVLLGGRSRLTHQWPAAYAWLGSRSGLSARRALPGPQGP